MDLDRFDILDLGSRRLAWVDQRQAVLAQNVANSDTPGYRPADVPSFAAQLAQLSPPMTQTSPMHMAGEPSSAATALLRPHERAPDGNAVSIEDELTKIADTQGIQSMTANLLQKYNALFRMALGK